MKKKINTIVGSIGAFVGIFVFITYIPQIIANLNGIKGQPHQPTYSSRFMLDLGYLWLDKRAEKRLYTNYTQCNWGYTWFLTFITSF